MAQAAVKPIPDGMHTVTPHLVCAGAAAAIDFYKKAFNAVETSRMPGPDGKIMHASVRVGDSTVMPVADMFWGDRYGVFEDPFGHRWSIATHTRDMTPAQMQEAMKAMMSPECPAKEA